MGRLLDDRGVFDDIMPQPGDIPDNLFDTEVVEPLDGLTPEERDQFHQLRMKRRKFFDDQRAREEKEQLSYQSDSIRAIMDMVSSHPMISELLQMPSKSAYNNTFNTAVSATIKAHPNWTAEEVVIYAEDVAIIAGVRKEKTDAGAKL